MSTPSVPVLMESFRKTDFSKLLAVPQIENIVIQMRPSLDDGSNEQWKGVDLERLPESSTSKASYAIVKSSEELPVYVMLFDRRDDSEGLKRFFENLERELVRTSWVHETRTTNLGDSFNVYTRSSSLAGRYELVMASWGDTYLLATNAEVATTIVTNGIANEPTKSALGSKEAFIAGKQTTAFEAAENLILFVDPFELAKAFQTNRYDSFDLHGMAETHGLDSIKGIYSRVAIPDEKFDLVYKTVIYAPGAHRGAMRLFAFRNKSELLFPDWLPNNLCTVQRVEWDLSHFINGISGPINEMVTEGTVEEVLEDMKASDGPGVDLEKDLFSIFKDTVYLLVENKLPQSSTNAGWVVCIELSDAEKVSRSLELLFQDDPNVQKINLQNLPNPLWKFGRDARDSAASASPGLCVAANKLFLSVDSEAIKRLAIDSGETALRFTASEDIQETINLLDQQAGKEGCMRAITRIDQEMQPTYEWLRSGNINDSRSIYSRVLKRVIQSATVSGRPIPDFSSLPPFEEISSLLGVSGFHVKTVDTGWLYTGFIKRK